MKYKQIADDGLATYALIFDEGDEAVAELRRARRTSTAPPSPPSAPVRARSSAGSTSTATPTIRSR